LETGFNSYFYPMSKKLILTVISFALTAVVVTAQTGGTKGWSKEYRASSVKDCIATASKNISQDSATRYCQCMMLKLEEVYPDQKVADKLTQADLEKPELKKLIKGCLTMRWSDKEREVFLSSCEKSAAGIGAEKAKSYCNCMLGKLEVMYATASDADKITKEDLETPQWKNMIKACLNK
jgi:hypothetical protein